MNGNDRDVASTITRLLETSRNFRVAFFRRSFEAFLFYYYRLRLKDFHREWVHAMESRDNLQIVGFRGSGKTSIVRYYIVWNIIYGIDPYIVVQCYEDTLSGAWVREVAKALCTDSIVADYGMLFPFEAKKEDIVKRSFSSFETTNGIKVESKSLNQTLRGANTYGKDGPTRPTLLILDDIDIDKSVKNADIIDDNERKILGETIGALDPIRRRIIFLGNVINDDGIVPRFRKRHTGDTRWRLYHQPLIHPDGTNAWPELFTPEVIADLRKDGDVAFQQNYELIPYRSGQTIIPRTSFRFATTYPKGGRIVFGIDPAFSEKTNTDAMAMSVVSHTGDQRYIVSSYAFDGADKNEEKFCAFVESLYRQTDCSLIRIESNNGGQIIARMLQRRNLAVEVVTASRDKVTRLREHEGRFSRGEVYFLPGTEQLQDQLANFPNGEHDDMVDAMVYAMDGGSDFFFGSF